MPAAQHRCRGLSENSGKRSEAGSVAGRPRKLCLAGNPGHNGVVPAQKDLGFREVAPAMQRPTCAELPRSTVGTGLKGCCQVLGNCLLHGGSRKQEEMLGCIKFNPSSGTFASALLRTPSALLEAEMRSSVCLFRHRLHHAVLQNPETPRASPTPCKQRPFDEQHGSGFSLSLSSVAADR